jgi:hypothetical protein
MLAAAGGAGGVSTATFAAGAAPPGRAAPATHTTLPPEGRLRAPGVYEFAAVDTAADASDPLLTGTTITLDWSAVEPQPGRYDWSLLDASIAPWQEAGKHVIVRISAGSDASWGSGAGAATPGWVYDLGVGRIDDDGSVLPAYWDPAFVSAYAGFIRAYGARYDGDPSTAFVEMGIGEGGETLPDTQLDTDRLALLSRYGYDDQRWLEYVKTVAGAYRLAFPRTAVVALVDSSFLGPRRHQDYGALTRWLVRNGFPLQYDGLTPGSGEPGGAWGRATTMAEQRAPAPVGGGGRSLVMECRDAVDVLHSRWLLVYARDVDDASQRPALAHCGVLVREEAADPAASTAAGRAG